MRYVLILILALSACTPLITVTNMPLRNPSKAIKIVKSEFINRLIDLESFRFCKGFKVYALSN